MKVWSGDLTRPSWRPVQTWNASIPCLHTWLGFGSGLGAGCNIPRSHWAPYAGDGAWLLNFLGSKDMVGCWVPLEIWSISQLEAKAKQLGRNPGIVLRLPLMILNLPWNSPEGPIYPFSLRHLEEDLRLAWSLWKQLPAEPCSLMGIQFSLYTHPLHLFALIYCI